MSTCTNAQIYMYEQINNNTKLINNNTSYLQRLPRY